MTDLAELALTSKAWPFEEARKLVKRFEKKPPQKGFVLFETGYGPSGLPHIGTFGEVARTTMVRQAFETLSDIPTKLLCFSDDMDGLRKVPTNIPNGEVLEQDLNLPLTRVRDPFGTHDSFGAHNNARLMAFLDSYGFDYEFASSTDYYLSGRFDEMLQRALERFDKLLSIMLPTLGEERRATYSPFLPVSPKTGMCCRFRRWNATWPRAPSSMPSRMASAWKSPLPAATSRCSGSRTGRCAGPHWVSIMKCRARI